MEKLVINAFDRDYKKLYQSHSVNIYTSDILSKGILNKSKNIELDITSCRLSYPATPRFIDLFLKHLSSQEGDKTLKIKMGCISYFEWVCLNIIVLEGIFFGINQKISSEEDMDCVKKKINKKLQEYNIHMTVELDNKEKTSFDYGK